MNYLTELSNQQIIIYLIIINIVWIFLRFTIVQEFSINFFIRFSIVATISYILITRNSQKHKINNLSKIKKINLLKYFTTTFHNKKQIIKTSHINDISDVEDQINHETTPNRFHSHSQPLQIEFIEKHEDVIDFYIKYIELRNINFKQFNYSLLHFNKVLELKQQLINSNSNSINKKQLIDNLIKEKNSCLNELSSINVSINNNNPDTKYILNKALTELDKLLFTYYHHGISVFDNKNLHQLTYPKEYFNFTTSGNLNNTLDYSDKYTLYI